MYADREQAAASLVPRLHHLRSEDTVVLGLPKGGVPLAAVIASALDLPLDILVVRKVGVPGQPELAMGAVAESGVQVVNERVAGSAVVNDDSLTQGIERELATVEQVSRRLRGGRARIPLTGRTVVLVDDGIATGSTMRAACHLVRAEGAARVVVATPVASTDAVNLLRPDADEIVCLTTPHPFFAVGNWYVDFSDVPEEEVLRLLSAGADQEPGQ
jgi:putative phosphoribosyl transferase